MKFTIFTLFFFLVLSFFAFGQDTHAAYNAGVKTGEISSTPHPWTIPTDYKDDGVLEDAYRRGYAVGQANQRAADLKKGVLVEPIFNSDEIRTPTGERFDDKSVGLQFVWPAPWSR